MEGQPYGFGDERSVQDRTGLAPDHQRRVHRRQAPADSRAAATAALSWAGATSRIRSQSQAKRAKRLGSPADIDQDQLIATPGGIKDAATVAASTAA